MVSNVNLRKKEAKKIVTIIESLIQKKFEGYKNLSYNANTKGYDYEFVVFSLEGISRFALRFLSKISYRR
jgi:hypothetical protein